MSDEVDEYAIEIEVTEVDGVFYATPEALRNALSRAWEAEVYNYARRYPEHPDYYPQGATHLGKDMPHGEQLLRERLFGMLTGLGISAGINPRDVHAVVEQARQALAAQNAPEATP
jgi:hypothetical protein